MTPAQRSARIRKHYARLSQIEAEARQIRADLLPLETEESWSFGYLSIVRGEKLIAAMDQRDDVRRVA